VKGKRGTSVGAIRDDLVNGMIWDSPVVRTAQPDPLADPGDLGCSWH
jgi:hypothetical protein